MLVVENITKKFPGVTALDNVSLTIEGGKVTAVIGENGAGKSTLMKILSGVYQDFEGRILLNGRPVKFANPKEAQEKGIAIIHQELNLVPHLTVTENIFLGREITDRYGMLDKKAMRNKAKELLTRLRLNVPPQSPVRELKVGQQQIVEIAKALLVESRVIIMDEPTSAISESEIEALFSVIADLKREGKGVVYISHKLEELFKIAENYVVLRDGKMIESGALTGMTHAAIIRKMVGRDITTVEKAPASATRAKLFTVTNLCLGQQVRNVSFGVDQGEIVGIFGLMGAGRTELLESIFGLHAKSASGEVSIDGKPVTIKTPAMAIKAGLALVPEDRKKDGLILGLNVKTNITLTVLPEMSDAALINRAKEQQLVKKYMGDLRIKTPSDRQLVKNLSGGNQQKIVLAKWLATKPKVLMLDEPTRGIDINAKNEIYKLIVQLAAQGLGIIVASSELPEILAISDRILVMCEGKMTAEYGITSATEHQLLQAAIPRTP